MIDTQLSSEGKSASRVRTLGKMRQRKEILVAAISMLGLFGTMTFGGEDILGSGDCEVSPITPCE